VRLGSTLTIFVLAVSTASCAATTYDSSISTATLAPTTTVLPTGTAEELLPQLVTVAAGLSALILDSGDKLAAVERMEALWAAVRTEVTGKDRDLATEIGAEIAKGRHAAVFDVPAGADKVYIALKNLVQAYLTAA
jgi:hypothetical protein